MKFFAVLILPALALAAATHQIAQRQTNNSTADPATCLQGISGISACAGGNGPNLLLTNLLGCPINVVLSAVDCVLGGLLGGILGGLPGGSALMDAQT